jgi:sulfur-oxidizing protein SoxZ
MATGTIKVRAKATGGVTEVKALMTHPMETGLRKDKKTGELVPAHFIQEVTCTWKDQTVMAAHWGGTISTNPYLAFKFSGAQAGDEITLKWSDNKGDSDSETAAIS